MGPFTFDISQVPTVAEMETAIRKLKNNKAPGLGLIQAEIIKNACTEYFKHLRRLIVKIWLKETISEEWNLSIVCPIHKKGDITICTHYRGISLLCITYKFFSNILFLLSKGCHLDVVRGPSTPHDPESDAAGA
jgi:hypothetical protein